MSNEMEEFDVIVLGTGFKECILSGLVSAGGKKVLHLDKNNHYGGESASLNLSTLYGKFKDGAEPSKALGSPNNYNVDLCPKFLMACGDLVKILVKTKVADYLDFCAIGGSFVYQKGKIHKVPSTAMDALKSSMLGLLEKNRYRQFISYVAQYDHANKATHKHGYDLTKMTAAQLYKKFNLSENCQQFTGHAVAVYLDDSYLTKPALELVQRAQLYAWSIARYGNSPYIYPKYGLGNLPEGFSRRCAVYGGTFMLNMGQCDPFVEQLDYDGEGKIESVTLSDEVIKAYELPAKKIKTKQLIASPAYFVGTDKVKKVGRIARCIAIMSHPIPNTGDVDSCQLIIPAQQAKRKSDMYVCLTSSVQCVSAKGKYIAVMSTNMETDKPEDDLALALELIGAVDEKFVWVSEVYEPTGDGSKDNCYVASSMDATTHFQSATDEVKEMYKRVMGEDLDLTMNEEEQKEQN